MWDEVEQGMTRRNRSLQWPVVSWISAIRYLLIDLDGVLYRGQTPIPDASRFVSWARESGIKFRLVTNNSTLGPEEYARKLDAMGIPVTTSEVFTSAQATAAYLQGIRPFPARAYVIGETGLIGALESAGIASVKEHADCVVVGLDRTLTYDKLADAALAIRAGARFVASNADRTLPTERGLVPGAGSIVAALTAATGAEAVTVGKPKPLMFRMAMESLGAAAEEVAVVGDRLDTDIEGAAAAGLHSILVLTGVSTRQDVESSPVKPDAVCETLTDLMRAWGGPGWQPMIRLGLAAVLDVACAGAVAIGAFEAGLAVVPCHALSSCPALTPLVLLLLFLGIATYFAVAHLILRSTFGTWVFRPGREA
jgi:4-nitrophenyl phosphatase